jgi:glycosyltransferase involved in cell wall biosynthesis
MKKRKSFSTAKTILTKYGFLQLLRATYNKATGRPLLTNIDPAFDHIVSERELDESGNRILKRQQTELSVIEMRAQIVDFQTNPLFSVVMPLYNSPVKWLKKAIESLQSQVYENWELCAVDDGSKDRRCIALVQEMMASDPRIRLDCQKKNGGISAASNVSLEMAQGEYIALMDHDDEIPADAFFWFAKEINEHPEADFIYSDECKVYTDEKHNREFSCFYLKPDWSPFLLVNHMYTGHMTLYRSSLVRQVGGFRTQYDFSQDYDLALRVSDATKNIRHLERVLYYWRIIPASASSGAKDYARVSNMAALRDWYARRDLNVVMERTLYTNYGSLIMDTSPKVSIIIPSDTLATLSTCIHGLLCNTSYKNIELIPVTNGSVADAVRTELPYLDQLNICLYEKNDNIAEKYNSGAAIATGEFLIFLNEDVVPHGKDWIERLIELLRYPEVGGVSPLLLNADQTIAYAGMFTKSQGLSGTTFSKIPNFMPTPNPYNHMLLRDVSVLCTECIAIDKSVFHELGGFDDVHTPTTHFNLDISLKLVEAGYRCVYNPHSIISLGGKSRIDPLGATSQAEDYWQSRWGMYFERDPFFTDSMKELFAKCNSAKLESTASK